MTILTTILLAAACTALVWLDARGVSLAFFLRRWHLIHQVHKNLGLPWRAARRIVAGDGVRKPPVCDRGDQRRAAEHDAIRRVVRGLLDRAPDIRIADCLAANPGYDANQYLWVLRCMVRSGELVRLHNGRHARRFTRNPLRLTHR
jgi:hypothetical protein